jgi:hypothetical protein
MTSSRKFVAATILAGLALIAVGVLVAPFAHARGTAEGNVAADRINTAFAVAGNSTTDPVVPEAPVRSAKGDLPAGIDCAAATWPNIDSACLIMADGRPAPHVRTVLIASQADANTTVLLRIPSEVAQN